MNDRHPAAPRALNAHGDRLVATTGRHGADIAHQRMDALDTAATAHALAMADRSEVALDLGCGFGTQGLRFASLGHPTLLVDRLPLERTVMRLQGIESVLPLAYLQKDARVLLASDLPTLSMCYSQRFIHYLRYAEAAALLGRVRSRMREGARLFLSASGMDSELGEGYSGAAQPLADRYQKLADDVATQHGIHEPVCLYTASDLMTLCAAASFHCERVDVSPFGNVKGIFTAAATAGGLNFSARARVEPA